LAQISQRNLAQIDPNLPMLVIGGECDPVSAGKRLTDLADALRAAGNRHVQLRVYPRRGTKCQRNQPRRGHRRYSRLAGQALALGRPVRSE
jgi:dienelactone hydrolase